jgi:RNA polymerase sigma-70 factor (ECF subfamily)
MTATAGEAMTIDDGEWLARLFDRHQARLYRFALRLAGTDDEAKDLVQDAFVRAAHGRVPARDDEAMSWLVRVVVNLSRDRWRRRRVREAFHRAAPPAWHDPTAALDAAATVRAALSSLPPRQRAIVVLHHLDGESVAAIAVMLRVAQVTVRWHLAAARKRLRERIER